MQKLDLNRIKMIKDVLIRPFSDPYVEVPIVNTVLQILGYPGQFEYNEKTGKISYHLNKDRGE